jgi:hypothetical protein
MIEHIDASWGPKKPPLELEDTISGVEEFMSLNDKDVHAGSSLRRNLRRIAFWLGTGCTMVPFSRSKWKFRPRPVLQKWASGR